MPALRLSLLALAAAILPQALQAKPAAQPVRLEITSRAPAFDGQSFGEVGDYEKIEGVAHLRIDPRARANRKIVDLSLAPRAADGMVEYDVDVVILRPRDASKARRVLVYDTVNRGMKLLSMFTGGAAMGGKADPIDPGDGLLLRQGYTLVWSGWQGDIGEATRAMLAAMTQGGGMPPGMTMPAMMGARFPVARGVTGPVSTDTIFDNAKGNRIVLPFAATSMDQAAAQLTVRVHSDDPPVPVPASRWRYVDDSHVLVEREPGSDAGAIYNFRYTARDPYVMGLGFAATRDFISWLRHAKDGNPLADIGDASGGIYDTTIALGLSQSARYLRDFLWQGFNADLAGRKVFDGVIAMVPGGRQTFTNFRFAEPSRFSRQHEDHDVPGFTFPFTYATIRDPVTGASDGVLRQCEASGTCPKLFHVDTSGEFWQAGAGLVGTGGTDHDVPFPASVRAYMIAGGSHAPGLPSAKCRYPVNPLDYAPIARALLSAMVDWTLGKAEPPSSRWPSVAKGELVPFGTLRGPESAATGLEWPKVINRPVPLAGKPAWPDFVPAIDADGHDRAGIHLPQLAAPLGTYLGWNLRKPGFADGDLCFPEGSFVPFAANQAARGDDPRWSLAERYPNPGDRAAAFRAAVAKLRGEGLLLAEDAAALDNQAETAR